MLRNPSFHAASSTLHKPRCVLAECLKSSEEKRRSILLLVAARATLHLAYEEESTRDSAAVERIGRAHFGACLPRFSPSGGLSRIRP